MNALKKAIIILTLLFSFAACDPAPYFFDYEDLHNEVIRVELIDHENPEQRKFRSWVKDHSRELVPFKLSNMTVLETLDHNDVPTFLKQVSETEFLHKYYVFDSPKGICIRVIYENGDFLILSCDYDNESFGGYVGIYNSEGDVVDFIGSFCRYDDFESLVGDYFETVLD